MLAKKLATVMMSTSRCWTCELVRDDALELARLEEAQEAARDADGRRTPGTAHRERVRHVDVGDRDLRLRQVGLDAQALDERVQPRRLGRRHLVRAHRAQRELVGQEELREREAGDDDEHDRRAHARADQHGDERHVEQAEQDDREQHARLQAEIAAICGAGGGHGPKGRSGRACEPSGPACIRDPVLSAFGT
jgi:hypothetical protein